MSEIDAILSDPVAFISRLKIIDKDGKLINLIPNQEQLRIIEALMTGEDTLILKGRQIGSSTIIAAFFFWKVYTSREPVTCAILSYKLASSKHLLSMYKTFYNNLPSFLKRELAVDNTTELKFADTGASLLAVAASQDGGLRSFSCSMLHLSEYAFSPNPHELKATALSALNNGQLIIESTANHFNDALHQEIMKYERGEVQWNYLFFPWFSHQEYSKEIPEEEQIEWTDSEIELQDRFELTDEQMYWRRLKSGKLGKEKFTREYPATIEDAYSVSGNIYLKPEDFEHVEIVPVDPVEMVVFDQPSKADQYAIGVDVAAGVGRDYSVIFVISKTTHQPVAIYRSNEVVPVVLAQRIIDLSQHYNNALVLIESNNFGNVVLNELRHQGFYNIWQENGRDWITTIKSKTEMFENLKDMIQRGYLRTLDNITYSELRALQVNEKGHIQLPEQMDSHGDNVVAMCLAYVCLSKVRLKQKAFLPDFVKKRRAERITTKAGVSTGSKRRY